MTQNQFEAADQEAMDLANRVTKPPAGETERNTDVLTSPAVAHECCTDPYEKYIRKANRARELLWAALKVVLCVAVTFALMVALARPEYLEHLANLGIVICCVAGGIVIDRAVRRWRVDAGESD